MVLNPVVMWLICQFLDMTQISYTGRSPLEAGSIGIDMLDTDVSLRCNLVTLSDEEKYEDKQY